MAAMPVRLIRKLEHYAKLSAGEIAALEHAVASHRQRELRARDDLIQEGDKPTYINLVLEGWAYRYKVLEDGRRQILGFLLPGDICDHPMFLLERMDHSIGALTSTAIAQIPGPVLLHLAEAQPRFGRALWWSTLVESAIQRQWIMNIGQRQAIERLAHLFCELFLRLRAVGLTDGNSCDLPLTQTHLAEATGMSVVHVNRTIQELREADLIMLRARVLTIPRLEVLMNVGLFNSSYLHLDRDGERDRLS